MGNVLGVVLGVGNRPRQGRAVLEILLLVLLLKRIKLAAPPPPAPIAQLMSPPALSITNTDEHTNGVVARRASMTVGAPPSLGSPTAVQPVGSLLARLNTWLHQFEPLQVVLAMLIAGHIWNNLSLLLGLNAPHHSMTQEPDMHYSKSFASIRWLLTGLDAATLSTLKVKVPFLRHALTLVLSVYYLINRRAGENQVNAFRNSMTHEAIRACWEKSGTPLLAAVDKIMRKRCTIDLELVEIPSPDGHMIECRLFYPKERSHLQNETRLLLDLPGGGFIAMSPSHHADYLSFWAQTLGVAIISVNYRKAPEFPFPCGFDDSWAVYRSIIDSNGASVGINCGSDRSTAPIRLAIAGDSAGGNLATGITVKAILKGLRTADGIHLIYPVLDFAGEIWKSTTLPPPGTRVRAREAKPRRKPLLQPNGEPVEEARPVEEVGKTSGLVVPSVSLALPAPSSVEGPARAQGNKDDSNMRFTSSPFTDERGVPQLSSRTKYAFDGVLPFKYMLLLADCYFRNGGDPVSDVYASPAVAPDRVLAKFPPLYAHVGSVDPLVDDVVKFARRTQLANHANDVYVCVIPKVSHAYLHVVQFLPEAKLAVDLSTVWLANILQVDPPKTLDLDQRMTKMGITVTNLKDICAKTEHEAAAAAGSEPVASKLGPGPALAPPALLTSKL